MNTVALVEGLSDEQLVAAATGLGVTEHAVDYFGRTAYEIGTGEDGEPRMAGAIISQRPGASAEVHDHAEQAAATVREHLRDRSGKSWDDYDRKVLQRTVLEAFAHVGDAYLEASESTAVRGLAWRRLSDGSMRADVNVANDNTVSGLIKVIDEDEEEQSIVAGPDVCTEFYRTGRPRIGQSYMCYVGIFDKGADESDVALRDSENCTRRGPTASLMGKEQQLRSWPTLA